MSDKVKLPKEVAEAIEFGLNDGGIDEVLNIRMTPHKRGVYGDTIRGLPTSILLQALVNGYEVEMTPEEKVRELSREWSLKELNAVSRTLEYLSIKISGVNA